MAERRSVRCSARSRWSVFRSVLGALVLLMGLIGMQGGVGADTASADIDTRGPAAYQHVGPTSIDPAGLVSEIVLTADPVHGDAGDNGLPYCPLEASGDTCASTVIMSSLGVHLAAVALTPVPGQRPAAPPLPWVAHFRLSWTPSLVQLAVNRT